METPPETLPLAGFADGAAGDAAFDAGSASPSPLLIFST
jgi:hypothetical protein